MVDMTIKPGLLQGWVFNLGVCTVLAGVTRRLCHSHHIALCFLFFCIPVPFSSFSPFCSLFQWWLKGTSPRSWHTETGQEWLPWNSGSHRNDWDFCILFKVCPNKQEVGTAIWLPDVSHSNVGWLNFKVYSFFMLMDGIFYYTNYSMKKLQRKFNPASFGIKPFFSLYCLQNHLSNSSLKVSIMYALLIHHPLTMLI